MGDSFFRKKQGQDKVKKINGGGAKKQQQIILKIDGWLFGTA